MKRAYITTEIGHWNDVFRLNQQFMSNFIFRGQGDAEWPLATSLARMVRNHHPYMEDKLLTASYEERMMGEFKWKYPSYEKVQIPADIESIEWLSLMQHYGSPTRMLDFSYSMYIALFMAIDGSFSKKSAIWALNKNVLQSKVIEKYSKEKNVNFMPTKDIEDYIYVEATNAINRRFVVKEGVVINYLYPTRPHLSNERIPSTIDIGFEEILKEYYDDNLNVSMEFAEVIRLADSNRLNQQAVSVLKIEIPKDLKYGLTNVLRQMNITSETMYPGLDGLARSMSCLRDSWGDYKKD